MPRCRTCKDDKDTDLFVNCARYKSGKATQCRECAAKASAERREKFPGRLREIQKRCYERNREEFKQRMRDAYRKDIDARRQAAREYCQKNREKCKEQCRDWYRRNKSKANAANRERYKSDKKRLNEISRQYHRDNKERIREQRKAYRAANAEAIKQKSRDGREKARKREAAWRARHPDNVKSQHDRQRARKNAIPGYHTQAEWRALRRKFQDRCVCCGVHDSVRRLTRDHVVPISNPLSSDDISNIQPLCYRCNCSKKDTHATDYRRTPFINSGQSVLFA